MTRRFIPQISLCAAVLGLALSSPALAQPAAPAGGGADVSTQAMQLYNEGLKAAKQSQWEKARTFYLSAWRAQQHWQIAANLGRAEIKVSKFRDAAEHLTYFLREAPKIEPEDRKRTQELLDQAKAKVGTLTINASPPGATILIDGAEVGTAPLKGEVFVEPGQHVVEAQLEGYGPKKATLVAGPGRQLSLDLSLSPAKIEPEPPKPVVPTTPVPTTPDEGESGGPNKAVVVVGGVLTGVAAAVGVGFTVGAKVKFDQRGPKPTYCPGQEACDQYIPAETARAHFGIAAITGYVAAGVLGVATLTYVLASPSAKPKSTARAGLLLGPGTAGANITVSW